MDLYDILIAKKLAGDGGGGGGGDVETATIVITVTNGTAAITSGAFPDWFTPENFGSIYGDVAVDCEYGKGVSANYTAKICACPLSEFTWAILGINYDAEKEEPDMPFITGNYEFEITSIIEGLTDIEYTNGTLAITLIYMPN